MGDFPICIGNSVCACDVCTISTTKCGAFRFLLGNFRARNVRTISTTKCGAFRFLLGIFMHATYIPFQLPSVGLSGFFWEFSCMQRTYHFNYQVWGFPVSLGNFRARDIRTMAT